MALIGKAPLTTARLASGSLVAVRQGQIAPAELDTADAKRLVAEGYLAEIEEVDDEQPAEAAEPVGQPPADGGTPPASGEDDEDDVEGILEHSVPEVLEIVGSDAELAAKVLAAEQAADAPRKGVLEGMQKVIDAEAQA